MPVHLREYRAVPMEACWNAADFLLQTRPANCPIDGVGILTILNKPEGPELLLQKQYRPPIGMVVVEVPAGLIDAGESPEECAVRELKEETGYVGVAEETSPVMYNGTFVDSEVISFCFVSFSFFLLRVWLIRYPGSDPGLCNTNLNMVHVRVDMTLPENQNPKPQLEDNEFIECFSLPLGSLFEEIKKLEAEGYAIDARVGTVAEGIEVAKKFRL